MLLLLYLLLVFMIIGAVIAIETKDLLSSVICVGAIGLALAIVFLLLGAPDLAIVQVVVEVLSLVLLLRVVTVRDSLTHAPGPDKSGLDQPRLGLHGGCDRRNRRHVAGPVQDRRGVAVGHYFDAVFVSVRGESEVDDLAG